MAHSKDNDLGAEDKELLKALPSLDLYRPLIKLLNRLVEDQCNNVLDVDLNTASDRDLTLAKARMEGARKLVREVASILEKLKKS